jgi:hypothetical protein
MTFIYAMPPNLFQKLRNLTPSIQSGDSIKTLNQPYKADALKQLWEDIMKRVHSGAVNVMTGGVDPGGNDPQKLVFAVPSFRYPTETEMADQKSLRQLGGHPQGFFTVFVSVADYARLTTKYFGFGTRLARTLPPSLQAFGSFPPIAAGSSRVVPSAQNASTTTSTITNVRVETAGSTPRIQTQNKVMGNVSAAEVNAFTVNHSTKLIIF